MVYVVFVLLILSGGRFMLRYCWIVGLTEYSCIPITKFAATLTHFPLPSNVSQLITYSVILIILVTFF